MPNKENIRKWVEALRSGEYEQGSGVLCSTDDKYCCLGVACEVAIQNGIEIVVSGGRNSYRDFYKYDWNQSDLPLSVIEWLGVDDPDPELYYDEDDDNVVRCIHANDELKLSFLEIADRLEAYYLAPQ